ncbi:MAG: hypothetical protein HYY96_00045 [Candidatus Tectomicrobia bacterium]|nr:hypothetical protein [Candidatus Tectomicrobia bacterium]
MTLINEQKAMQRYATFGYLRSDDLLGMYEGILKARLVEEELYRRKMKEPSPIPGTVFDSKGQEALSVGMAWALEAQDLVFPSHRDAGFYLVKGLDPYVVGLQFFAKREGPARGRDLNWHLHLPEQGVLRFISHMGAGAPILSGAVWAANYLRQRAGALSDETRVVGVICIGEGASNQGAVLETMNAATVLNIPVVWLINLNRHAISVLPEETHPFADPLSSFADRARGFGMPGIMLTNGWDVEEVYYRVKYALERARQGFGPALVAAQTYRFEGHNRTEPTRYRKPRQAELEHYLPRDPLAFAEFLVLRRGLKSDEELGELEATLREQISEAFDRAEEAADPQPTDEDLGSPFADPACEVSARLAEEQPPRPTSRTLLYGQALNEALKQAMQEDERVVVFGEDVKSDEERLGGRGGVYGITHGLTELFGLERCFNTPLSEAWLIGFAGGLAYMGVRAVTEIQFFTFLTCGFSQLVDIVATHYWQTGHSLPLVIRVPGGYVPSSGTYHSLMEEMSLLNFPGLKVVFPADAFEAKGLLLSAIKDPDPVIFLEQIHAYSRKAYATPVPEQPYYLPLGKAQVRREGTELSIITYGALMVHRAEEAARQLADDGVSVEVLNMRTLKPLDRVAILASYAKTGRAIVLHESVEAFGFGGEVARLLSSPEARARSRWGDAKEPPLVVLGAKETGVPGSLVLEEYRLPSQDAVIEAARVLMEYGSGTYAAV